MTDKRLKKESIILAAQLNHKGITPELVFQCSKFFARKGARTKRALALTKSALIQSFSLDVRLTDKELSIASGIPLSKVQHYLGEP